MSWNVTIRQHKGIIVLNDEAMGTLLLLLQELYRPVFLNLCETAAR